MPFSLLQLKASRLMESKCSTLISTWLNHNSATSPNTSSTKIKAQRRSTELRSLQHQEKVDNPDGDKEPEEQKRQVCDNLRHRHRANSVPTAGA